MTVVEIKPEPRNKEAVELLRGVTKFVEENPLTSEVLVLVSICISSLAFSSQDLFSESTAVVKNL